MFLTGANGDRANAVTNQRTNPVAVMHQTVAAHALLMGRSDENTLDFIFIEAGRLRHAYPSACS